MEWSSSKHPLSLFFSISYSFSFIAAVCRQREDVPREPRKEEATLGSHFKEKKVVLGAGPGQGGGFQERGRDGIGVDEEKPRQERCRGEGARIGEEGGRDRWRPTMELTHEDS